MFGLLTWKPLATSQNLKISWIVEQAEYLETSGLPNSKPSELQAKATGRLRGAFTPPTGDDQVVANKAELTFWLGLCHQLPFTKHSCRFR
jgi:hypothetical protein